MTQNQDTSGELAFASHWQPPVQSGKYMVTVKHVSTLPGFKSTIGKRTFVAHAERFQLRPEDIYSIYPPRGATGLFSMVLPNVIFTRATYPWERSFFPPHSDSGQDAASPFPWLCLLLLSEEDEADPEKEVRFSQTTLADALEPRSELFIPSITPSGAAGESGDTSCRVLDLSYAFFRRLVPSAKSLQLAAHVRKVNLDYKVTDPSVARGVFACLVSSRFTRTPDGPQQKDQAETLPSRKYTAHVVSLEECEELFRPLSEPFSFRTVRLFSLFQWNFYVQASDFDFKTCMENLDVGAFGPQLPFPEDQATGELEQQVLSLTKLGFIPMEHRFRDGSGSISWYRGPLCPGLPMHTGTTDENFSKLAALADENLLYDARNGMFDVSRSVPWQVGRLKALEDQGFTEALIRWRMELKQKAALLENKNVVNVNLNGPRPAALATQPPAADSEETSQAASIFSLLLDEDDALADPTGLRGTPHGKALRAIAQGIFTPEEAGGGRTTIFPEESRSAQEDLFRLWDEEES